MKTGKPIQVVSTRSLRPESLAFAEAQGWLVTILPMIEVEEVATIELINEIQGLLAENSAACLLFTSSNGVKAVYHACLRHGIKFPKNIKALCVGERTAALGIELLGLQVVARAGHAAALLEKIAGAIEGTPEIVFPCGNIRLETLPQGLEEKGYRVHFVEVYQTQLKPVVVEHMFDSALFFSPSSVKSFFKVNQWPGKAVAAAIGQTTAGALKDHGVKYVIVPEQPDESLLLKALKEYLYKSDN